jgi:hypothetical protein
VKQGFVSVGLLAWLPSRRLARLQHPPSGAITVRQNIPVLTLLMSTFCPLAIIVGVMVMLNIRNCSEAMAPTLPSLGQYTCGRRQGS